MRCRTIRRSRSASFSPYNYLDEIPQDVAVYAVSGWTDGAGYANGVLSRYLTLPNKNKRVLLGPWDHGARVNSSPWRARQEPEFPVLGEVLRFFDQHLAGRDTGLAAEDPIHYFAVHAEEWRAAKNWPPVTGSRRFYLAPGRAARRQRSPTPPASTRSRPTSPPAAARRRATSASPASTPPTTTTTGSEREAKLASFTTAPLEAPLEIAGHTVVSLWLTSSEPDAAVFVYLSEVEADGTRALRHRGRAARDPSRRGAGAARLPHDLAVAQLRAQGRQRRCRSASRSS